MNNKELILIILAILVGGCIIAGAIMVTGFTGNEVYNSTVNNTTNKTVNLTDNDASDEIEPISTIFRFKFKSANSF